ncbi:MAG: beta-N-acetylhexosaminidase [Cyclobacteriaceae bacterium]|nr:beta-N-acetylhexosaminidase [Cyclobacteriaceae bacterium]
MKRLILLILACILIYSCTRKGETAMNNQTDIISVIPLPDSSREINVVFYLENHTRICIKPEDRPFLEGMVKFLNGLVINTISARLEVSDVTGNDPQIILLLNNELDLGKEGYHLMIDKKQILIEGETEKGIFYGIQTLRQILPAEKSQSAIEISGVEIFDHPRFSWRGLHLDVSRHFMPVDFIKKYLDYMAMHKLNMFHWHLTDDQGWRIEIKKYPKLTKIGAWRNETLVGHFEDQPQQFDGNRYGGYYTQQEIREIVQYAGERCITIVPEIELPGHAQAAIAAYPELGVTGEPVEVRKIWGISPYIFNIEESSFEFIKNVLAEVTSLFPGEFVHIGGDEAVKDQWAESVRIQQKMKALGIRDEHGLQSWFIQRIDSFLASRGKRLIGWDEILEGGLAPNAAVMSWRGEEGGIQAAKAGHDVVMTPTEYCYFDYYQAENQNEPLAIGGFLPLAKVYGYNPVPASLNEEETSHILGVQANVWTEYMATPEQVEYMVFPRIAALSEIAWTSPERKSWPGFRQRIKKLAMLYKSEGINYSRTGLEN